MSVEMQIALLGIIGTLVGTVLGWFLNNLSQRGKLNIYVSSWKDKFEYNHIGTMVPSSSIEQTESYSYRLALDLYNDSGETKIMRNVEIVFAKNKEVLYCSVPKDEATGRTSHPMAYYDDVLPINIPPKTVLHIELFKGVWKSNTSLDFIWKTTSVFLRYVNENNKKVSVMINKVNYKDYFIHHKTDEQDNE
ncbi:hypothetical protein [Konateibacter massiliensis]|uniref:hypothetical protein n=1 Tax=Konateibacter massiliensis TaxID=2002841 RepID=UPI000C15370A|nr:hypothetical protein [Konateibacter massiliensis]